MSKTIWKFAIHPLGTSSLLMPADARPVLVGMMRSGFYAWFELDSDQLMVERTFRIVPTGGDIEIGWKHIGSFIDGLCVWHLYEVWPEGG